MTEPSFATHSCAQPTSAELLVQVSRRDRAAFRMLYDRHNGRLFAVCLSILRDRDAARDALQDALVKIWARSSAFREGQGEALGWLITLTRRVALDHRRKLSVLPQPNTEFVMEALAAKVGAETPDAQYEAIWGCLRALPESRRVAISLVYLSGLTQQELAGVMSRPLGTVKSWLRRGLIGLKQCLEKANE